MQKKVFIGELSDGITNPNDWVKSIYLPFHKKWTSQGSETWKVFYFLGRTKKGKPRVYDSYGRTVSEAKRGLEKARVRGEKLKSITKAQFTKLKLARRLYKEKLKANHKK